LCVNPEHLKAVSMREAVLGGNNPAANNARKTHCVRGHPLSGDNVHFFRGKGGRTHRYCRTCKRMANAKASRERKEVNPPPV
jgi:hypothetical protein